MRLTQQCCFVTSLSIAHQLFEFCTCHPHRLLLAPKASRSFWTLFWLAMKKLIGKLTNDHKPGGSGGLVGKVRDSSTKRVTRGLLDSVLSLAKRCADKALGGCACASL